MILIPPIVNTETRIDFYAGNNRSFRVLLPLWELVDIDRRGSFFVSRSVSEGTGTKRVESDFCKGSNPVIVSTYKDLNDIFIMLDNRSVIMFENDFSGEVRGLLNIVSLFVCYNERSFRFHKAASRNAQFVFCPDEAVMKIKEFIKGKDPVKITEVNGNSVGIVYMAFGQKAFEGVMKSVSTLRRIGYEYPVCVVGDLPYQNENINSNFTFIQYDGTSPFDPTKARNFQFRAGRIKPQLCRLTPFTYNLYIDADTHFVKPIHEGFELLKDYDLVVTEEKLSLEQLYNMKLAGWEINLLERDKTIKELGPGSEKLKFINSGVIFFKRSVKTLKLFSDWHRQWMRFQEWDEQLALMRAINKNKSLFVKHLSVDWNSPHPTNTTVIFHNYGRGDVRANI